MKLGALSFQVALSCALHTQLGWNVVCFRHVQKISLSLRFSRPSSPPLSFFNLVAQLVGEGLDALLPCARRPSMAPTIRSWNSAPTCLSEGLQLFHTPQDYAGVDAFEGVRYVWVPAGVEPPKIPRWFVVVKRRWVAERTSRGRGHSRRFGKVFRCSHVSNTFLHKSQIWAENLTYIHRSSVLFC